MLACKFWLIFQSLKSHNSVNAQCNATKFAHYWLNELVTLWCKANKIAESMGVLQSFVQNYVKYANMEGFCKDSHIL